MSPSIWATAVFLGVGAYCLQNKEVHQGLCFLLCGCKMQQFAFSLDGCPSLPLPLGPKWLYWSGSSLNVPRVYISPSWVLVSYQGFKVLATFCSVSWNSIMSLMQWIDVIFCGMSRWSRSFLNISQHRFGELPQPGEKTKWMLFSPRECCFWSSFLMGIKRNAFAKSVATYHVLEVIFICSSNETTSSLVAAVGVELNWQQSIVVLQDLSVFFRAQTGELDRGMVATTIPASLRS